MTLKNGCLIRQSFNELYEVMCIPVCAHYLQFQFPLENSSTISLKSSMCEIIFPLQKQTSETNLQCNLLIKLD